MRPSGPIKRAVPANYSLALAFLSPWHNGYSKPFFPSLPTPATNFLIAHHERQQIRTLDKSGNEITSVGFKRFGFDSEVPLAVLRSLYLRPDYTILANDAPSLDEEATKSEHTTYQSKSIYHPDTQSISYTTLSRFPPVKLLAPSNRKRILVTGGAGFVGSHLVDRLMLLGHEVTVIDNFFTGSKTTVSHWIGHPNFEIVRHDVVEPFMIECDRAWYGTRLLSLSSQAFDQRFTISPARRHPLIINSTQSKLSKLHSWARSICSDLRNASKPVSWLAAHPVCHLLVLKYGNLPWHLY